MSEYNKLQLSTFVLNDQLVVRADTAEELEELAVGLAERTNEITEAFNKFKEVYLAKGVMTGGTPKGGGGAAPKSAGTPAAATAATTGGGDAPKCGCGVPMIDTAGKGYKKRWYADKKLCRNKGEERACWAKP